MDYKFTLKRFFVLVFLFVICPLVGWIAYAHRTNAPSNLFEGNTPGAAFSPNSVTIPDNKLDMSTPYYQNDASVKSEKALGRTTNNTPALGYYEQPEKEGEAKTEKSSEKQENSK